MRNGKRWLFSSCLILVLFALALSASAQWFGQGGLEAPPIRGIAPAQESLITVVVRWVNYFLAIVGLVAVVFLIWGGVQYIISAGQEEKIESAKKTITYAILGLLVIGLAAVIVNFVIRAFTA